MHNWDLCYGKVNNNVEVEISDDEQELKMMTVE
jgi:hypothetical protein